RASTRRAGVPIGKGFTWLSGSVDSAGHPLGPVSSRPPRPALREDRNGSMPLLENAETAQCRSRQDTTGDPGREGPMKMPVRTIDGLFSGTTITYTTKMTSAHKPLGDIRDRLAGTSALLLEIRP